MKTLCKKSFIYNFDIELFTENKWYTIIKEETITHPTIKGSYYQIQTNNTIKISLWFSTFKNLDFLYQDYFYTKQELRQLKLKKLQLKTTS